MHVTQRFTHITWDINLSYIHITLSMQHILLQYYIQHCIQFIKAFRKPGLHKEKSLYWISWIRFGGKNSEDSHRFMR